MSDRNKPAQAQVAATADVAARTPWKEVDHPYHNGIVIAAPDDRSGTCRNGERGHREIPAGSAAQLPARREARSTYRGTAFA